MYLKEIAKVNKEEVKCQVLVDLDQSFVRYSVHVFPLQFRIFYESFYTCINF